MMGLERADRGFWLRRPVTLEWPTPLSAPPVSERAGLGKESDLMGLPLIPVCFVDVCPRLTVCRRSVHVSICYIVLRRSLECTKCGVSISRGVAISGTDRQRLEFLFLLLRSAPTFSRTK